MKKELKNLINNNPWFARYYNFEELEIVWLRDNKQRESIYEQYDFSEKTIIDVWCNLGKNFIFLSQKNPKKLIGVDLPYSIEVAKKIKKFYEISNTQLYSTNLNALNWFKKLETETNISTYDYSLFVSVYGTKELKNRDNILKTLINHTKDTLFFEGHHLENHSKYSQIFLKQNVKNFYFHWYLRDKENDFTSNVRPFFTVSSKFSEKEDIIKTIQNIKQKKWRVVIWLEWLAGSGKSTFVKELENKLENENMIIIDDLKWNDKNCYKPTNTFCKILSFKIIDFVKKKFNLKPICKSLNHILYNKTYDFVIISDYKLRKYVNNVDVLINIEVDEKVRKIRLKERERGGENLSDFSSQNIQSNNFECDYFFTIKND